MTLPLANDMRYGWMTSMDSAASVRQVVALAERYGVSRVPVREALRRDDQLSVAFQPLFSRETGAACGAEALVRWTNPNLGRVSPAHFVPVAEVPKDMVVSMHLCRGNLKGMWMAEGGYEPIADALHRLGTAWTWRSILTDRWTESAPVDHAIHVASQRTPPVRAQSGASAAPGTFTAGSPPNVSTFSNTTTSTFQVTGNDFSLSGSMMMRRCSMTARKSLSATIAWNALRNAVSRSAGTPRPFLQATAAAGRRGARPS